MSDYTEKLKETSEILKALSHPSRLCIVNKLASGNLNVSQMQECMNISQSNISQHLSILRKMKIIDGERKGSEVIYYLTDKSMVDLLKIFF